MLEAEALNAPKNLNCESFRGKKVCLISRSGGTRRSTL